MFFVDLLNDVVFFDDDWFELVGFVFVYCLLLMLLGCLLCLL